MELRSYWEGRIARSSLSAYFLNCWCRGPHDAKKEGRYGTPAGLRLAVRDPWKSTFKELLKER
jgi:hypothetical protein